MIEGNRSRSRELASKYILSEPTAISSDGLENIPDDEFGRLNISHLRGEQQRGEGRGEEGNEESYYASIDDASQEEEDGVGGDSRRPSNTEDDIRLKLVENGQEVCNYFNHKCNTMNFLHLIELIVQMFSY